MSSADRTTFTPEATAAFAEIIARHERGEPVDFQREFALHEDIADELRALYVNWIALDDILGGLAVSESAIDDLDRELKSVRTPIDVATREELERLSSPDRMQRRYVVRERIARGGMGEIWRVFDADLERDLAMKVVRARVGEDAQSADGRLLRRFLFEARLTGRLEHPGIAPVHDIGIDGEGRVYFTMPLVRGRSLAEILELARDEKEGWTRSRVLEIVLKVCDALAFAHAQGVVHRDLKPANVMVGRFGETYVMDWGLARVLAEIEVGENDQVVGTAAYMAPEQAKGLANEVGPRSDVYALGAILYELLAGRRPYATDGDSSSRAVIEAVRAGPPRKLEDVADADADPELVAIAKKAMVRSPDGRYAGMDAMAADLRAYMEGRVVRAHEVGRFAELRKWITRNRLLASTVAVALTSLGALAVWFGYSEGRSAALIQRLGDLRRVEELEERAERLWPSVPTKRAEMETWLADAEALVARAPLHERELAALRAASSDPTDREAAWRIDALATLVDRLARFCDPWPGIGTIASVRRRFESAERIERESRVDAAEIWRAAIAEIGDPARAPAYRGLVLTPQFGLVPLGPDRESGLQEFAHLPSGKPATRDDAGRIVMRPDSGIVFVLVPGGSFHMGSLGAVPGQPSGPRTDPGAAANEMPFSEVSIAPYFVAKFETTVAQWAALSDSDLSLDLDPLEPARALRWVDAETVLRHAGLVLPTEAQWEYAARAGTTSRWWCGREPGTLRGVANGAATGFESREAVLQRVDTLRGNPFGLVHVHGNVAEWTRDVFTNYDTIPSRIDGERLAAENGFRCARGGSFVSPANDLRSAARERVARENRDPRIGVRAARAIEGLPR